MRSAFECIDDKFLGEREEFMKKCNEHFGQKLLRKSESRGDFSMRKAACLIVAAVLASAVPVVHGQAGDLAAIQGRLNSQFKLTTTTADRSDIVTAGDVVVIHKQGLLMYAVASPMPPSNTYKNGKIGQGWGGFGKDMAISMATPGGGTAADYPHRPFVPEEKCWVTGIQVQGDGVLFQLYSDPYENIRYYANLKIPFPDKKTVPTADIALQTVAEVLTVVQQDDQASQAGQPAPTPAAAGSSQDSLPSIQGTYFRKNKSSDTMEIGPYGVFALVLNGRKYEGNYTVQGEDLKVWGPQLGQHKFSLVGNVIKGLFATWEKPVTPTNVATTPATTPAVPPAPVEPITAPAPISAPMPDIAPPPPPPDAPPPTVAVGQTKEQVTAAFGQPMKAAKIGAKEIFYYKDMKVTFMNGKVSNVE
jgi:hypothetical protein